MLKILGKTEEDVFNWCLENFENEFLYRRFQPDEFFNKLRKLGFEHNLDIESLKNQEEYLRNDYPDFLDYTLTIGINEGWGYIDIWYLYDNQGNLVITELNISEE